MEQRQAINQEESDSRLLLLAPADNVAVVRQAIPGGERIMVSGVEIELKKAVAVGHKIARRSIASGEKVLKYGVPIGSATADIEIGDHVHLHNIRSDYTPTYSLDAAQADSNDATGEESR